MTTEGNQKHNQNNHPFRGHAGTGFAPAHNGVIFNGRVLRRERQLPDTQVETDSFIAVQLIESKHERNFDSIYGRSSARLRSRKSRQKSV